MIIGDLLSYNDRLMESLLFVTIITWTLHLHHILVTVKSTACIKLDRIGSFERNAITFLTD